MGSLTKIAALVVLSGVAGLGAGIAADRIVAPRASAAPAPSREGDCPHREALHGDATARLADDLGLDAAQREAVVALVRERHERFRELQAETCRRLAEERDALRAAIAALLDDEQRARFEALCADQDGPPACCREGGEGNRGGGDGPACPHASGHTPSRSE